MRHILTWAALLLFALPVATAKGKKDRDKDKYMPTPEEVEALVKKHVVEGKVGTVEGSSKGFTFIYEYTTLEPRKNAGKGLNRQQQQLLRQLRQIQKTRNPIQQQLKLQQFYARLQLQGVTTADLSKFFNTKTVRKDFDLQATEEVKVRLKKLPVEYDDKGNVKKYTAKEKEELKGKGKDRSLPGYQGTWDNVAEGQKVKVYLKAKKKKAKKAKDKEEAKDKEAAKDKLGKDKDDDEDLDDSKPLVTMIIIQEEPDADEKPAKGKRNK